MTGSEWRHLAACKDQPPDLFFPRSRADLGRADKARRICQGCPVMRACLNDALRLHSEGVWGGTTQEQRRRAA